MREIDFLENPYAQEEKIGGKIKKTLICILVLASLYYTVNFSIQMRRYFELTTDADKILLQQKFAMDTLKLKGISEEEREREKIITQQEYLKARMLLGEATLCLERAYVPNPYNLLVKCGFYHETDFIYFSEELIDQMKKHNKMPRYYQATSYRSCGTVCKPPIILKPNPLVR